MWFFEYNIWYIRLLWLEEEKHIFYSEAKLSKNMQFPAVADMYMAKIKIRTSDSL